MGLGRDGSFFLAISIFLSYFNETTETNASYKGIEGRQQVNLEIAQDESLESHVVNMTILGTSPLPLDLMFRSKEYHIMQFRLPLREQLYTMYLVRNKEFLSTTNSSYDKEHSFFLGEIHPNGRAALSVSKGSTGLSGYIIVDGEHFMVESLMGKGRRTRRSISHKFVKISSQMNETNESRLDVLHVPIKDLEKAVAEMASASGNNGESEASHDNNGDDEVKDDDDDDEDDVTANNANSVLTALAANRNNKANNVNKKPIRNKKASVVEVSVFTDSKLLAIWQDKFPKDPKAKLRSYILNAVHNMNLIYQQPSLGVPIAFKIVHFEMLSKGKGPSTSTNINKYLDNFCKFAGEKNSGGKKWDHAIFYTGHSFQPVIGVAYFATMCLQYYSCSITSGSNFGGTVTLAHEIGHSLGMEHDGERINKGCDSSKFVMAPKAGIGQITWSKCSTDNIKNFIASGSPELKKRDRSAIPTCLNRASTLKNQALKWGQKLPGEVWGLSVQCQLAVKGTSAVTYKDESEVCTAIFCGRTGGQSASRTYPALEGSSCGNGKHCRHQKCVKKPAATG